MNVCRMKSNITNACILMLGLLLFVNTEANIKDPFNRMYKAFVYGTLKRGQPNNQVMVDKTIGKATFLGTAKTVEKYPLVISGRYNIPFLLPTTNEKSKHVVGEVYDVDESMMKFLDAFESVPEFYERMPVKVKMDNSGQIQECGGYFLTNFKEHLLDLEYWESYDNDKAALHYTSKNDRSDDDVNAITEVKYTTSQGH